MGKSSRRGRKRIVIGVVLLAAGSLWLFGFQRTAHHTLLESLQKENHQLKHDLQVEKLMDSAHGKVLKEEKKALKQKQKLLHGDVRSPEKPKKDVAHATSAPKYASSTGFPRSKMENERTSSQIAYKMPNKITIKDLKAVASMDAVAVVVIACKRPQYLKRALESFLKQPRDPAKFPIIVSQDGFDVPTSKLISKEYGSRVFHIQHQPKVTGSDMSSGYTRVAQHYGFAMQKVFDEMGFQQAIFLEEDMEIAPDFYSYFSAMLPILRTDKKLFCVSAWNDNGVASLVQDPKAVYRTDFFPGLGWMLTRSMWHEVAHRWPDIYWDEFMRRPDVRKGRQCIRPEINRSLTFGEQGVSAGQFYNTHLKFIKLNETPIHWEEENVSLLKSEENFDAHLSEQIKKARAVSVQDVATHAGKHQILRIAYEDSKFLHVAKKFGLMEDEKAGIRRMSYRGVISFAWKTNRIFLHTRAFPKL